MDISIATPKPKKVTSEDLRPGDYFIKCHVESDANVRMCVEQEDNTLGYIYLHPKTGIRGAIYPLTSVDPKLQLKVLKPLDFKFEELV